MTDELIKVQVDYLELSRANLMMIGIKDGAMKATARAINRTLDGVKTDASAAIREIINAKKKDVDRTFKIAKATTNNPRGMISSTGAPLPLATFSPRKTKKGISIQVKKDRPRKVIERAFIATMKSGHVGAFWRAKKGTFLVPRLPIHQLFGPRVPDIFSNEPVMNAVLKKAASRLDKNMAHEVDFILMKEK